jgi:hypothetical protein
LQISPRRGRVEKVNDLNIGPRRDALSPVGIKHRGDFALCVGRGKTAVTGFFPQKAHDFRAVFIEDKHGDSEAEVFQVLTDTEKISCEVVVKKKVLDFIPDLCSGYAGIIPQSGAIADLGVEHLTSGEGIVLLDVLDDFERHKVVTTPRNVREMFVNDCRHNIDFLAEDCGRVDSERGAGFIARQRLDGIKIEFGK